MSKRKIKKHNKKLVVSSLFFTTNALAAMYLQHYVYCFFFFCLTITSVLYHLYGDVYKVTLNVFDKMAISSIVVYGGYVLYIKPVNIYLCIVVIFTFLSTLFLYCYGYYSNQFCFHPNKSIGNNYHCALHALSCIGHHCILFS